MKASLIICTRNRDTALGKCLAKVRGIIFEQSWELIVVDNASTDSTQDIIADFAKTSGLSVVYVHESKPGLSNARNAGVAVSKGEIITFTDDDCYVDPLFLQSACAAFDDAQTGVVSGRIMLFDPDDYPATINESLTALRFEPRRFIAAGTLKGANLAFRHTVLDQIGPFDPLFGSGAYFPAEDADAVMRASMAGWVIRYVPEMVVYHHHGRKAVDIASLHKAYDIGRGAYHAKLLGLQGGLKFAIKAWITLPKRMFVRPTLLYWELYGATKYWSLKFQQRT
jgi:glycosyltransferase involved in cell wall biosynthesis